MKEIDNDYYCSAELYLDGSCRAISNISVIYSGSPCNVNCPNRHRKWPTPEQFKEEYGEDVPDNMIVCTFFTNSYGRKSFNLYTYGYWKKLLSGEETEYFNEPKRLSHVTVCCTPFGKPDPDWRPV